MTIDRLYQKFYFSRPDFVNGTARLHELCRTHIAPRAEILEVGAGPANQTSAFLSSLGKVAGLDISDEVLTNGDLASAHLYGGGVFPFENGVFDGCVSDFVLEHVESAREHFAEIARVLRPGGVYCFRTPNRNHYVALMSSLLPHSFHLAVANRLRGLPPSAHDPYPTFYRANTKKRIVQLGREAGLEPVELIGIEPEPSYGKSSPFLFYPMLSYERFVNCSGSLQGFRASILGVLRKPLRA